MGEGRGAYVSGGFLRIAAVDGYYVCTRVFRAGAGYEVKSVRSFLSVCAEVDRLPRRSCLLSLWDPTRWRFKRWSSVGLW